MKNRTRLSIVVACALLAGSVFLRTGHAGPTINLTFDNNAPPYQSHWLGANAVYFDFDQQPDLSSLVPANALADAYQRVADSGVKMVRTYYPTDWALQAYPDTTGGYQWTSPQMTAFYGFLQHMQSIGVKVIVTTGWHLPDDECQLASKFTISNCLVQTTTGSCSGSTLTECTFAHWVSDSLNELINVQGFTNVAGVMVGTETNYGTPALNGPIPTPYNPMQYYAHLATQINNQILADDASRPAIRAKIKIIGSQEGFQGSGTDTWTQYLHANTSGVFDVYTDHTYCKSPTYAPLNMSYDDCLDYNARDTKFAPMALHAAPAPLWVDEMGAGVKFGDDFNQYRWTGDEGVNLADFVAADMDAGVQADFDWTMQDQPWIGTIPYSNNWGLAKWPGTSVDVYPDWYLYSLLGNLLGGGNAAGTDTAIYRTSGNTATLHGSSLWLMEGTKSCTQPGGCLTFMVVNAGSSSQSVSWNYAMTNTPLTFYRYVYNAGNTPRPAANRAARVPMWDSKYVNVTTGIAANVIPARSVVFYSTQDMSQSSPPLGTAPVLDLAPPATTTASSTATGYAPSAVNDLDTSHTTSALTWKPDPASTGPQYVELDWSSNVTFNRIELDFTGSSLPLWDAGTTTPPTDYSLQYWSGSAWVDFSPSVSVGNNGQNHRTHTFTAVTSSKLRYQVPGPTSSPISEVGVYDDVVARDTTLALFSFTTNATNINKYDYEQISTTPYAFQAGDTIEYDVKLLDKKAQIGGIDVAVAGCTSGYLRNSGWVDRNGVTGHPGGDITAYAYDTWYHRVLNVPACAVGQSATSWLVADERDDWTNTFGAEATAFYDNLVVKHSNGTTAATIYVDGAPNSVKNIFNAAFVTHDVLVLPKNP